MDSEKTKRQAGAAPRTGQLTVTLDGTRSKSEPRAFPATLSTDTPVQRMGYSEVLAHTPEAIDMTRFPLPVIEGHNASKANVAVVRNQRIEHGKLRGDIVFGSSARARELMQDIDDGIVTGLSVGYSITQEAEDDDGTVTATRWMPYEVSIVAMPADLAAGFNRSRQVENDNSNTIEDEDTALATRGVGKEVLAERKRVAEITEAAKRHNLERDFTDDLIARGVSVEKARAAILNKLADKSDSTPMFAQHSNDYSGARTDFRDAVVDSLLIRGGVPVAKPHAAAGDVVGMGVVEIARTCLSRAGVRSEQESGQRLIQRAMSTSDFPYILSGVVNKAMRAGFETEPQSHTAWVRRTTAKDFKDMSRVIMGSAPDLEAVAELGTYTFGSFAEDSTSFAVTKFGKMIRLSWEALVNDDLGAFARIPQAIGQAARRKEADEVYALLAANSGAGQTMQDAVALFHATHGNLATTGDLVAEDLGVARALLRKQTTVGGGMLNLVPRYLIVPAELETEAEVILSSTTRHLGFTGQEAGAQSWISSLKLVVEPRLAANAIYLATSGDQVDTCELALLEEVQVFDEPEFDVDAKRWKVRHTFAAKFIDWRGIVKMPITP